MTEQQTEAISSSEEHGSAQSAVTPRELYRFDVQGFLVITGALTDDEVAQLNEAVDANQGKLQERLDGAGGSETLAGAPQYEAWGAFEWPKPWCYPFRALIAHPRAIGYLNAFLGRGWHLDHQPQYFQSPKGASGLGFHLGEYFSIDGIYYHYKAGQIRSGLTVLQWALADQGGDLGGFACIPGSHKANFPRPREISLWQEDQDMFVCPEVKAGDLIIFSEATTHGALPWTGDHDRRAVLHRYAPGSVQVASGWQAPHSYRLPEWVDELDPAARLALEPAHAQGRDVITADRNTERAEWPSAPPPFSYEIEGKRSQP